MSRTSLHPADRLAESARKIRAPFALDPSLCIYSPQANLDALRHPRVAEWLEFLRHEWEPPAAAGRRVALIVPCTKYKPYNTSREHRAINGALLAAGWRPAQPDDATPPELFEVLDPGESRDLLNTGPLRRGEVTLDRIVMSEPLAMVPYPYIYQFRGGQSPATSYDDPGLFEGRGTSVSPEREDCTAVDLGGKWRWGPNERAAFAAMHNTLVDVIAATLVRVGDRYDAIGAWVSPGLTHRSFLADTALRKAEGLPRSKRGPDGPVPLRGVLDQLPGAVEVMPTLEHLEAARSALAERLVREGRSATAAGVNAVYARGDGNDTPLGLPEALEHLTGWLDSR